jgi:uncharacterized membrane protein YgcG
MSPFPKTKPKGDSNYVPKKYSSRHVEDYTPAPIVVFGDYDSDSDYSSQTDSYDYSSGGGDFGGGGASSDY